MKDNVKIAALRNTEISQRMKNKLIAEMADD
jgi:hypothetical protein